MTSVVSPGHFRRVIIRGGDCGEAGHASQLFQEAVWYIITFTVYLKNVFFFICVILLQSVSLLCGFVLSLSLCVSVCDVLPLVLNNPDMCLPASLLYKYLHKAAEFYICYVTREPSADGQMTGKQSLCSAVVLNSDMWDPFPAEFSPNSHLNKLIMIFRSRRAQPHAALRKSIVVWR